jgi:hypothetical protein
VKKKYVQNFGGQLENRGGNGTTVLKVSTGMCVKIHVYVLNFELN